MAGFLRGRLGLFGARHRLGYFVGLDVFFTHRFRHRAQRVGAAMEVLERTGIQVLPSPCREVFRAAIAEGRLKAFADAFRARYRKD